MLGALFVLASAAGNACVSGRASDIAHPADDVAGAGSAGTGATGGSSATTESPPAAGSEPTGMGDSAGAGTEGTTVYVSTRGNDVWSGSLPSANTQATDGPFATIQRALDFAAMFRAAHGGTYPETFTIAIRGGTYPLSEPVRIGPEHSGSANARLRVVAYQHEIPIVSGGRAIHGFEPTQMNGQRVWRTTVPEAVGRHWMFHQLWVNGQRHFRARPMRETLPLRMSADTGNALDSFRFNLGDLPSSANLASSEAIVFTKWIDNHLPINSIDGSSRTVSMTKPAVMSIGGGTPYLVENVPELLDEPGEWFIDYDSGALTYFPMSGESIDSAVVVAPSLGSLLNILGKPEDSQFVSYVEFDGLTFSHNEWYFPDSPPPTKNTRCIDDPIDQLCPQAQAFGQASVGVPALVSADGLLNSKFSNCTFSHIGTYALQLREGVRDTAVTHSVFQDLGAGAIKLGQQDPGGYFSGSYPDEQETARNEISDNLIDDLGNVFTSACGVWLGQTHDNTIVHNRISNTFYSAVSTGWSWGYQPTNAHDNLIAWNEIHHVGKKASGEGPYLSDMGGVYSLGIQPGTLIDHNLIHDVDAADYGGQGIYFDQATSQTTATNNVVYGTFQGGFFQNFGRENTVRNNIFAFDRERAAAANQENESDQSHRFDFVANIVLWTGTVPDLNQGSAAWNVRTWGIDLRDNNLKIDSNLYWFTAPGSFVGEVYNPYSIDTGLPSWQARSGQDASSILQDPLFRDAAHYDFSLLPNSPAFALGFHPIDLTGVGPRP